VTNTKFSPGAIQYGNMHRPAFVIANWAK